MLWKLSTPTGVSTLADMRQDSFLAMLGAAGTRWLAQRRAARAERERVAFEEVIDQAALIRQGWAADFESAQREMTVRGPGRPGYLAL